MQINESKKKKKNEKNCRKDTLKKTLGNNLSLKYVNLKKLDQRFLQEENPAEIPFLLNFIFLSYYFVQK